eukprot:Rhum_TRINITY_DN14612_c8_g1::Rhum_TRINITY_DN14612_c8_g1_i1::g.105157::m.105157
MRQSPPPPSPPSPPDSAEEDTYEVGDGDGTCDFDDSDLDSDLDLPQPQPLPRRAPMAERLRHRGQARRRRACERFLERERVCADDDQINCTPEIAWKSAVMFLAFWCALSTAALDTDTDQPHVPPVLLRQPPQRHLRRQEAEEGYCARLEVRPFASFAAAAASEGTSSPASAAAAERRLRDTCVADVAASSAAAAAAACTSDCPLDSRVVAMPHGASVSFVESGVRDRQHRRLRVPGVWVEVASTVGLTSTVHVSAKVVGASGTARTFAAPATPKTWTISDTVCYPAAAAAGVGSGNGAVGARWSLSVAGCEVRQALAVPLLRQDRFVEVSVASYYQPLASSRLPHDVATADGLPLSVLTQVHVAVHTLDLSQAERGYDGN